MANPDTADIRPYLTSAYSDEEITVLCTDYFRDVSDNFATGMTKGQKIQLLLDHCQRRELIPNLFAALQKDRPEQYRRQFGQVAVEAAREAEAKHQRPAPKPWPRWTRVTAGLMALMLGPESWNCFTDIAAAWYGKAFLFVWTWAFAYHLCNGIRHVVQDFAIGFSIPAFIRSSWLSVFGSLLITALVWVCALSGGAA